MTIAETDAALLKLGRDCFSYPPFASQKKLRFHGDVADNFLSCSSKLFRAIGTTCSESELQPIRGITGLFDALQDIVRRAYHGPADGTHADAHGAALRLSCFEFYSRYSSVMGHQSKPLYLHIVRHHLAPIAMRYGGLGAFCCEKVEELNLILRRVIDRRCGGCHVQFHTMRWAMTMVYLLGRTDLLPTVRAYEKIAPPEADRAEGRASASASSRGAKRYRYGFADLSQEAASMPPEDDTAYVPDDDAVLPLLEDGDDASQGDPAAPR